MVRWLLIAWAALCLLLCGLVVAGAIPPPQEGLLSRSPWFLGVAAFFFLFLAASDWIARLRAGLSPEQAAEMYAQRVADIGGWLREQLTAKQAQELLACGAGKDAETVARAVEEWVRSNLEPGDELWYYDTGCDTWENLCGERGLAIVQGGQVKEFWMYELN